MNLPTLHDAIIMWSHSLLLATLFSSHILLATIPQANYSASHYSASCLPSVAAYTLLNLSLFLFLFLSLYLSLSVYLCVSLSLAIQLSIYLSVNLTLHLIVLCCCLRRHDFPCVFPHLCCVLCCFYYISCRYVLCIDKKHDVIGVN